MLVEEVEGVNADTWLLWRDDGCQFLVEFKPEALIAVGRKAMPGLYVVRPLQDMTFTRRGNLPLYVREFDPWRPVYCSRLMENIVLGLSRGEPY